MAFWVREFGLLVFGWAVASWQFPNVVNQRGYGLFWDHLFSVKNRTALKSTAGTR
jgi:hypothetical protein